jgi:hypothetical protein
MGKDMISFNNIKEQELFEVPVPRKTESYSPVSHKSFIEAVKENLDKHHLAIANANYRVTSNGQQVIGTYDIKQEGFDELGMKLAFRNSYNKTMSAALVAGSNVWICGNGMISGEMQFMRKHTGSINSELNSRIIGSIEQLSSTFELHLKDAEAMKNIHVERTEYARLAGQLFLDEEIITATQLGIMKSELEDNTYSAFEDPTLWSFYNHATHALKTSHTLDYIDRHVRLHQFVEIEYNI